MKKLRNLLSPGLVLALCLGLSVPAQAAFHDLIVTDPNGEEVQDESSGDGWTYDGEALTLNGTKDLMIEIGSSPTIVLAPGSQNTLIGLWGGDSDHVNDITIKGTGELIIYNPNPDESRGGYGVFSGLITSLKLEDGLTMTGGTKEGGSGPVEIKVVHTDPVNGFKTYSCMAGNEPAMYVRIAPKGGAEPADRQEPAAGFTDVAASSPYAEAIKWAVDRKITAGKTANTFAPGDPCTRAQTVTFLWRAAGSPEPKLTENQYMDVTNPGVYYYKAVQWAAEMDMEHAGTFDPNDTCERWEAVYFIWKAAGSPKAAAKANFADMPEEPEQGQYYYSDLLDAVDWAVEKGVTKGKTAAAFAPSDPCTRGQIAAFLYRAMK